MQLEKRNLEEKLADHENVLQSKITEINKLTEENEILSKKQMSNEGIFSYTILLKLSTHKSYYAMTSTVKYIVPILYLETGASSNICNGVQNGESEHEDTNLLSQKLSIANEEKEKV